MSRFIQRLSWPPILTPKLWIPPPTTSVYAPVSSDEYADGERAFEAEFSSELDDVASSFSSLMGPMEKVLRTLSVRLARVEREQWSERNNHREIVAKLLATQQQQQAEIEALKVQHQVREGQHVQSHHPERDRTRVHHT